MASEICIYWLFLHVSTICSFLVYCWILQTWETLILLPKTSTWQPCWLGELVDLGAMVFTRFVCLENYLICYTYYFILKVHSNAILMLIQTTWLAVRSKMNDLFDLSMGEILRKDLKKWTRIGLALSFILYALCICVSFFFIKFQSDLLWGVQWFI